MVLKECPNQRFVRFLKFLVVFGWFSGWVSEFNPPEGKQSAGHLRAQFCNQMRQSALGTRIQISGGERRAPSFGASREWQRARVLGNEPKDGSTAQTAHGYAPGELCQCGCCSLFDWYQPFGLVSSDAKRTTVLPF